MTIASEITRLQNAKASIEASIENKGVTVPDTAKLDEYYQYIDQITSWSGAMEYIWGVMSLNTQLYYNGGNDWTQDKYWDYSYIDGSYLYLIKPVLYMDYSQSGSSEQRIYFKCISLAKWASTFQEYTGSWYSTGWNRNIWEIKYYYFYKEWNVAHFKFWMNELYAESSSSRYRKVQDITYDTSTNTWWSTVSNRDWNRPSSTWWDIAAFKATLVWSPWSTWWSYYIQRKPN